jgi:Predicted membrane protein
MPGLGLVVLRLVLAVVFVAHGANILFGAWAGPGIGPGGLQITAQQYAAMGLHPEFLLAVLAGVTQLVGGLLLGLGLLTRFASAALLIYIGVGVWKEHLQWGFFLNWLHTDPRQGLGIEYSVTLAGALICLAFIGGGAWSIDGQRQSTRASRAAGRARLRGKM